MKLTKEDFKAWKKEPMTVAIYESLEKARDFIWEIVHNVEFVLENKERYIRYLGNLEGIELLIEMSVDDLKQDEEDEDGDETIS